MTITIHLSDRTVQALQERVEFLKLNGGREMTVALLCKQLIENGVADWRSADSGTCILSPT